MNTLSDEFLMMEVKAGKLHALGLLYERYKKRLFGFFYRMNKNRGISEDLVQNVFERVLKYSNSYSEEKKFMSWLFQIARNVQNDNYKNYANHQKIENEGYKIKDSFDLHEDIELQEHKEILQQAINRLSPEKKELLILSRYKEMKYKDIAEIVGSTEGAVRTNVHRIVQELKGIFTTLNKR